MTKFKVGDRVTFKNCTAHIPSNWYSESGIDSRYIKHGVTMWNVQSF